MRRAHQSAADALPPRISAERPQVPAAAPTAARAPNRRGKLRRRAVRVDPASRCGACGLRRHLQRGLGQPTASVPAAATVCARGLRLQRARHASSGRRDSPSAEVGFSRRRSLTAMEEVLNDIALVSQTIGRVEAEVKAVEAAIKEAKTAGDKEELEELRIKVSALLDKENKLRDEKNKLLDEKITLLRLQGTHAATLGRRVASCARVSPHARRARPRAALQHAGRLYSAAAERRRVA